MLGCLAAAARVSSFTLEPECKCGHLIYIEIYSQLFLYFVSFQGCSRQTPLHVRPSTAGGSAGNCRRALQKCDGVSPQVRSRMHNAKYDV